MPSPKHHLAPVAAFASIGAAVVHAAVVPAHAGWQAGAAFFAGLAMFQLCWGVLALTVPTGRAFLGAGALVNAGTLVVWLVSRTAGMPFGPHTAAEPFARTDVIAAALEIAVVGAALRWARRPAAAPEPGRTAHPRVGPRASAAVVSAFALVALTGAAGHAHVHPVAGPGDAAHYADGHHH